MRIESLGGEVIYYGSWRVNGILNVSRSIGESMLDYIIRIKFILCNIEIRS